MRTVQALVTLLLVLAVSTADAQELLPVAVSMKPIYDRTIGWSIESVVTNVDTKPLVIADAYLPWGNRYAMLMAAFSERRPNTMLQVGYPVDDPLFNRITIRPGEQVRGRVPLNNYFPGISEAVSAGGVIVLWSYQAIADDGRRSERQTGSFTLRSGT
jgi:hypothetical protein